MDKLAGLEFPELRETGYVYLYSYNNGSVVDVVNMPALQTVGNLEFTVPGRQGVDFRSLTRVNGNVNVSAQGEINYSSLTTVTGRLSIPAAEDYTEYGSLTSAGIIYLNVGANCTSLAGFEKLTRVEGDFSIVAPYNGNAKLADLSALHSLAFVGGKLTLEYLPNATSLAALQSLASVGSAEIAIRSFGMTHFSPAVCPPLLKKIEVLTLTSLPLEVLDVRGLGMKNITLNSMQEHEIHLINDGSVLDQLYIEACKQVDCTGLDELKSLNLWVNGSAGRDIVISGIKKIETASLSHGGASLTMPDLEEVSGKLSLFYPTILPKLKRAGELAGGDPSTWGRPWRNDLPELTTVDGNCTIATGGYGEENSTEEINLPKLTTIGGTLSIKGYTSSAANRNLKLKNLNGLSSLVSVKAVDIRNNGVLTDYSGLQNALTSFSDWTTADNAYNPSYQDMLDGKFTK
jgi:hypothetical protein